ncbi:hypothetical protein X738_31245 [Mesorhizobium sp. LNHC209A00]|nr:hypothetical protein X738_31245 [Mesorhizobium sp. LNHC209A00]
MTSSEKGGRIDLYLPTMFLNLLTGTVFISLTVLIHTFGLTAVTHAMRYLTREFVCTDAAAVSSP